MSAQIRPPGPASGAAEAVPTSRPACRCPRPRHRL